MTRVLAWPGPPAGAALAYSVHTGQLHLQPAHVAGQGDPVLELFRFDINDFNVTTEEPSPAVLAPAGPGLEVESPEAVVAAGVEGGGAQLVLAAELRVVQQSRGHGRHAAEAAQVSGHQPLPALASPGSSQLLA